VKHCHESLPHMVSGSLLGLVVQHGEDSVLEITHCFPFPSDQCTNHMKAMNNSTEGNANDDANAVVTATSTSAASVAMAAAAATVATYDGHEYQIEMMRMLREVNVDNNCIGWYQSMYLGLYNTMSLLENQFNYQTELSANSVVVLYDPIQTSSQQTLILKCYRLSDECIAQQQQQEEKNAYIDPKHIFEEIPVTFTNPGLIQAFLYDIADGLHPTTTSTSSGITASTATASSKSSKDGSGTAATNSTTAKSAVAMGGTEYIPSNHLLETSIYDTLDLSCNPYLEKHLDFMSNVVEDLTLEQQKFHSHARQLTRLSNSNKGKNNNSNKVLPMMDPTITDNWLHNGDAPKRFDSLLTSNQIYTYVNQIDTCTNDTLSKLFITNGLQQSTTTSKVMSTSTATTTDE
jgi:translation initiation factor 3 subunit H